MRIDNQKSPQGTPSAENPKPEIFSTDSARLLFDVLAKMNSTRQLEDLLNAIMDGARTLMQAEASTLWLYDSNSDELYIHTPAGANRTEVKGTRLARGEGISWHVFLSRVPHLTNDVQHSTLFKGEIVKGGFQTRNLLTVPLIGAEGEGIGVLQALNKVGGFSELADVPAFRILADQAAIAIERERMHENLKKTELARLELEINNRELARRQDAERALSFARGVEQERSRLARELHDAVLGNLSRIIRGLEPFVKQNRFDPYWLDQLLELSTDIRQVMEDLNPGVLEHFGLIAALENLFERVVTADQSILINLKKNIQIQEPELPDYKKLFIYRIFQEAAANVVRYSGANVVRFEVRQENEKTVFECSDNGIGFDPAVSSGKAVSRGSGRGLKNMAFRANMIGATLQINASPGNGVEIRILI